MKRIPLLLTSLFALVLGLLSVPAQAAPPAKQSGDVSVNGGVVIVYSVPLAFRDQMKLIDVDYIDLGNGPIVICPQCGPMLEIRKHDGLTLEQERKLNRNVLEGLRNLGLAHNTKEPDLGERYREVALANFTEAAHIAEKVTPEFAALGYYDMESGKLRPDHNESLDGLATELGNGLALIRAGIDTGSPEFFQQATVSFDAAYFHLAEAAMRSGSLVTDL